MTYFCSCNKLSAFRPFHSVISCVRNYMQGRMTYSAFRHPSLLLCCSLMLQMFKFIFFLINLHSVPHNDKVKTILEMSVNLLKRKKKNISHLHKYSDPWLSTWLKHLWQQLQPWIFLGMTQKLCTPGLGDFFFANPLKLGQVGRGPSVDSHFQVSPEMFGRVQVRALAGPL